MKRPSFQFYPADWRANAKLRRCSHAARGAWIDLLGLFHDSDEYGVIRWPLADIGQAAGVPMKLLRELADKGVLKGGDKGCEAFWFTPRHAGKDGEPVKLLEAVRGEPVWYCSRFIRDEYIRKRRGNGSRFTEENQPAANGSKRAPKRPPDPPPDELPFPPPKGGIGGESGDGPSSPSSSSCIPPLPPDGGEAYEVLPAGFRTLRRGDAKLVKVLRNTPLMARIGGWFGRSPGTLWSVAETVTLLLVTPEEADVELLESYYLTRLDGRDVDPRRRDLLTLLNNWPGELDRARNWKEGS